MGNRSFKAVLIVILVLSAVWLTLTYTKNVYYVPSRSMEPTLMPGDLIVIRQVSAERLAEEFKSGEKPIIVFNSPYGLIVHRIYHVVYDSEGRLVGFRTKGDNNPGPDVYLVRPWNVKGEVVFRIPLLGAVVMFSKSKTGFTIIGIVLMVLIVLNVVELAAWARRRKR